MKKITAFILSLLICLSLFIPISYGVGVERSFITSAPTPTTKVSLAFSKKLGNSYKTAPTPPVVVGDTLILFSGVKLYKLNRFTGEEIASVKTVGESLYTTVSPLYADGKIFLQLDEGIVQAFDFETMKSLWIYKDSLGGQALCPITYEGGYIFTGFWNDEDKNANYVCLSVKDENKNKTDESKKALWTYKALGGFYRAGSLVTAKYVIVGKDDGKEESTNNSKILCLDRSTGKLVSSLTVKGDIRSSIVYNSGTKSLYTSSKAGYVYKFSIDSSTGKLSDLSSYKASGAVTATPVVYGGRLYVGCSNGGKGKFIVLNASTMKEIYTCEMQGYPQATMLLSTAYENDSSKVYIYSTYNKTPGGITVFEDSKGQTKAVKTELYTPESDLQQYCISTISVADDGMLYYKNDSGNIFALEEKEEESLSLLQKIINKIKAFFEKLIALFKK